MGLKKMIKNCGKMVCDKILIPTLKYCNDRTNTSSAIHTIIEGTVRTTNSCDPIPSPNLFEMAGNIVYQECVNIIIDNLDKAVLTGNREALWDYCFQNILPGGEILEFGVFEGASINYFAKHLKTHGDARRLHGFDTFEGLPEDWKGWGLKKGTFNLNSIMPKVEDNVLLHKGLIQDTLPEFLRSNGKNGIAIAHIDVDIYSSAKCALELCKPFLLSGSIIIFDELFGYLGWKHHEYKALKEVFLDSEYEYIAFNRTEQVAIRIL